MSLVSEAGSTGSLGFWAAITWPLVASSVIQALAPKVGAGILESWLTMGSAPADGSAAVPWAGASAGANKAQASTERTNSERSLGRGNGMSMGMGPKNLGSNRET